MELWVGLGAGALAVEHRATAGARSAGGVHHKIGLSLACHNDDQLIRITGRRSRLCGFILFTHQICHGFPSSNAFDRHGDHDAVTRYADVQPPLLRFDQRGGLFLGRRGQDDPFFVRFDPEKIEHALHRRAAAVQRHVERERELLAYVLKHTERFGTGDGYDVVHALASQSSMIS